MWICICQNLQDCTLKVGEFQCTYILSQKKCKKKKKKRVKEKYLREDLSYTKLCKIPNSALQMFSKITKYFFSTTPSPPEGFSLQMENQSMKC